jgi:hypothetical protein
MIGQRIIEGARFGAYANCIVNVWEGAPRTGSLSALEALMQKVSPEYPSGIAFFVVVEPGAAMVESDGRKELEAFYARWTPSFCGVAQVVEGGNLWSVTARSVMTAMRLVQRRPYPSKVFSEVEEGTQWMAQYVTAPDKNMSNDAIAKGLLDGLKQLRSSPRSAP